MKILCIAFSEIPGWNYEGEEPEKRIQKGRNLVPYPHITESEKENDRSEKCL